MTYTPGARITGTITRAQALELIAALSAELANPYVATSAAADRIPVCAEFLVMDDEYTYFGVGSWGVTPALGACSVIDPEAEAEAAEAAAAARIESSYLMGR